MPPALPSALAANLKMHRARVTTAAAVVAMGPFALPRPSGSDGEGSNGEDSLDSLGGGSDGRNLVSLGVKKSRRRRPSQPSAAAVVRAAVPLPLPSHELPYLELVHSAVLPFADPSGAHSGNGGGGDLLARKVVLGNVINRLGRSPACDVCVEGPLHTLRATM